MQLPIAAESYRPSNDALIRAVKRTRAILARTGADETQLVCSTAFTHAPRPGVRVLNLALNVRTEANHDAPAALDELFAHYDAAGVACETLDANDAAWPEGFDAALTARGYAARNRQLLLVQQYAPPTDANDALQVIPARAAYAHARTLFHTMAGADHGLTGRCADDLADALIDQLDEPRVELMLGLLDGAPAACAGVVTLGQQGVIVPAYVAPDARRKGLGRTIMMHVLDHCVRAGFEQALLDRGEGCYSIPMYEALGFAPIGGYVRYYLAKGPSDQETE